MSTITTPLEIYKLLEKSNCGLCLKPSCMAFAAAVFKNEARLEACPRLDRATVAAFSGRVAQRKSLESEQAAMVGPLQEQVAALDYAALAPKLGATLQGESLLLRVLGKEFVLAADGTLSSECHIIPWVQLPLLNYALQSEGRDLSGEWVPFRHLKEAMSRNPFFMRRCEGPLKQIVDGDAALFFDLMEMFQGQVLADFHGADRAVVLWPLPKVPMLICYWEEDGDMDSKLSVFFDRTADSHLGIESIYYLGTGLVEMFKKVILTHGGL